MQFGCQDTVRKGNSEVTMRIFSWDIRGLSLLRTSQLELQCHHLEAQTSAQGGTAKPAASTWR